MDSMDTNRFNGRRRNTVRTSTQTRDRPTYTCVYGPVIADAIALDGKPRGTFSICLRPCEMTIAVKSMILPYNFLMCLFIYMCLCGCVLAYWFRMARGVAWVKVNTPLTYLDTTRGLLICLDLRYYQRKFKGGGVDGLVAASVFAYSYKQTNKHVDAKIFGIQV